MKKEVIKDLEDQGFEVPDSVKQQLDDSESQNEQLKQFNEAFSDFSKDYRGSIKKKIDIDVNDLNLHSKG